MLATIQNRPPKNKNMRHKTLISGILIFTVAFGAFVFSRSGANPFTSAPAASTPGNVSAQPVQTPTEKIILAAPGRIEGAGETVEIGSSVDGVLVAVTVRDGQKVEAGQILAIVSCDELKSEIEAGRAAVERFRQERARLLRGSRPEERQRAETQIIAAQSNLNHAKLHYQRMTRLVEDGIVARAEWDTAKRDYELAAAALRSAEQTAKLVNAPPLPEEIAQVDAQIQESQQKISGAIARLEKCAIKSPMSGTVLRVHQFPGESVSAATSRPVLILADLSTLRVRAEVDERDIGRVRIGQKAQIVADAYQEVIVTGRISSISDTMGRKKTITGNPSEKSDRDVLDVIIELDKTDLRLVIGLRVTARFLSD